MTTRNEDGASERAIEVDEATPLLARNGKKADAQAEGQGLDKLQIFLLCLARAPEALAFFSIFSFVNQMVNEIGVPAARVGFYTGLIESLLSVMQCITSPFWGRLSDTHGRKPLLVRSLFGLAISSTLFGMSTKVWHMILFRCLSGVFSGSGVTIRTMVTEGSAPGAQARGFSLLAFSSSVSILLAPLIGGGLAKPAELYAIFDVKLFVIYPYLLPCLVVGVISFVIGIATSWWLKETLKPRAAGAPKEVPMSTLELLESPGVPRIFSIYVITFVLLFSYTAVLPVFWFTPVSLGGYALTPQSISLMATLGGLGQTLFMLLVFPPLHARFGGKGILRMAAFTWCIISVAWPLINLALRAGISKALFWTFASICALIASALSMSYPTVQLAVNNAAPSPRTMGTLNGVAYSASIGARAVFPALFSGLYAAGVDHQILKGQLAWVVLFIMAVGYAVLVEIYPKEADGEKNMAEGDEEQNA